MNAEGRLFLIPAPIGDGSPLRILSPEVVDTIRSLRHFVVESERSAGRLLAGILAPEALRETVFHVLNEHTDPKTVAGLLEPALLGRDLGILSEAGCPCVADPGADLVSEAHRRGIRVVPLPGPSSILLALMASGYSGQKFEFLGYLPVKTEERRAALKRLEQEALRDGSTKIFIEAPYRNPALLSDALAVLEPDTRLCVAVSLGGASERILSMEIRGWRSAEFTLGREPAVFLLARRSDPGALTGRPSEGRRRQGRPENRTCRGTATSGPSGPRRPRKTKGA